MRRRLNVILQIALAVAAFAAGGCTPRQFSPGALRDAADDAVERGDTTRAVKLLRSAIAGRDAGPGPYAALGRLYRFDHSVIGRLRSHEVLSQGLQRYPDDPDLLLELGKTCYERTFYPDAAIAFERVLELRPEDCEAHYYLGLNEYRKWKHVQLYKEYLEGARRHFERVVACDPDNRDGYFKLAFSAYVLGDTTACLKLCRSYLARYPMAPEGLCLLGAVAFDLGRYEDAANYFGHGVALLGDEEKDAYRDIRLLLPEDDWETYDDASKAEREQLQRGFWAQQDPDPTTPLNEVYVEHLDRTFLADAYFQNEHPFLHGWDTERGKALIKFGWPAEIRTTLKGERSWDGRMEIWKYGDPDYGLALYFRDEFLNGNYMVPMASDYTASLQALVLNPATSAFVSDETEIPGVMDVVAFRNTDTSTDVYLAVKADGNGGGGDYLVARTALFDSEWHAYSYQTDTTSFRVDTNGRWPLVVRGFDVPFDFNHVSFCLEDTIARTRVLVDGEANTLRYLSDSLTVSDVLLCGDRSDVGAAAVIHRHDRALHPNPGGAYAAGDRLRLYFEVYNLGVTGDRSTYDVTYSIFSAKQEQGAWSLVRRGLRRMKRMIGFSSDEPPVISQTIERQAATHETYEDLAIDIDALTAGPYMLSISVTDRTTGETASRSTPFVKAGASMVD